MQAQIFRGLQCGFQQHQRQVLQYNPRQASHKVQVKKAYLLQAEAIPTVADTKITYQKSYPKPVPYIYANVLQEILVQAHFMVYNTNYKYNEIFALGIYSLFNQLFEGYDKNEADQIFDSFTKALQIDPKKLRGDAEGLEEWAKQQTSYDALLPEGAGSSEEFKKRAANFGSGQPPYYSRFLAIGIFRLLELTKAKDPKALEKFSDAWKVNQSSVTRDLKVYRTVLQKLSAAKDLFREIMEREKRKQAEREAKKASGGSQSQPESKSNGVVEQDKQKEQEKEGQKVA